MKEEKVDIAITMQSLKSYLDTRHRRTTATMNNLHKSNEVMTKDEMQLAVNLARILGSLGHGIDSAVCLDIINALLKTYLS